MKRVKFTRFLAIAAPCGLMLASHTALAAERYVFWGEVYGTGVGNGEPAVLALVHRSPSDNSHWIAWFPKDHAYDCNYVYWTNIGGATLATNTTVIGSYYYDDNVREITSPTTICGYSAAPVSTGGYSLTLGGAGGNDLLYAKYATMLLGEGGNDKFIWWGLGKVWIAGGRGADKTCSYAGGGESYQDEWDGGTENDCVFDSGGTYSYKSPYIDTYTTANPSLCGC